MKTLEPGPEKRADFAAALRAMVDRNWKTADQKARAADYEIAIVPGKGNGRYFMLREASGKGVGATVVIAEKPRRDAIAGVPHARFERGTPEQAALLLTELGFRAAILSGAHRCAADAFVACRGRTAVCSPKRKGKKKRRTAYRTSDVAHNPRALFHVAHEVLAKAWPDSVVFSLHGMRKRKGKPFIAVLSDGSKTMQRSSGDLVGRLRDTFRAKLGRGKGRTVSCNHLDDAGTGFPKLCGTTNVQGNFVNGSTAGCGVPTKARTGRFVHVEHTREIRRDFEDNWRRIRETTYGGPWLAAMEAAVPVMKGQ